MSQDIHVSEMGSREFAVRVTEGNDTTDHRVVVPASLLDDLLLDEDNAAELVHEAFVFLLERTHADAIAEDLVLTALIADHEDFLDEMRTKFE